MSKDLLENYRSSYDIDKVLDLLSGKGTEVIDRFSMFMTNVTNENIDVPVENLETCDMRILHIYDAGHDIPIELRKFFKEEIEIFKTVPNLKRAMYIFVSPESVIPKHCDDDDECFRIIYGVNVPSKSIDDISLVIEDEGLHIDFKEVVGVKSDVIHWGWNRTKDYWSVLTLCVEDQKLDELRKVY